jgi:hypothetical protein
MSRPRHAILLGVFLAGAAGGFVASRLLGPHRADAPSFLFRGPSAVERALDQRVDEISLNGETFDDAIVRLCVRWQVPIDVQWAAIDAENAILPDNLARWDPRRPIYFRARDVTLEEALRYVLLNAETSARLCYDIVGDRIVVSTYDRPPQSPVCRVYEVGDLVREGLKEYRPLPPSNQQGPMRTEDQESQDDLHSLVMDAVDPDSWDERGRGFGSVRWVGTRMVVVQTRANHRGIERLLWSLRHPAPQVKPAADDAESLALLRVWDERLKQFVAPAGGEVERALRERRDDVELTDLELDDAIKRLSALWSVAMQVDPDVRWSKNVTLRMRQVTLREALRAVLDSAGQAGDLRYGVRGGVIVVANNGLLLPPLEVRVYDLRGWPAMQRAPDERRFVAELTKLVKEMIDPEEWRGEEKDDPSRSVRFVGGSLIVRASRDTHDRLEELLAALRRGEGAAAASPRSTTLPVLP